MELIRDLLAIKQRTSGCVATIGNFDGLHLGHQRILKQLAQQAQQYQLPTVVISFEPLPTEYFSAHQSQRIYPFRDKVRCLEQLGVDYFLCLRFDHALANMPPAEFIQQILLQHAKVRHLVVGDDFCFGKARQGNYQLLKSMGQSQQMQVSKSQTHSDATGRISSTRIRQSLAQGDISATNALLGRAYSLSGRVRHGDKMGRTINFPTMNLRLQDNIAATNGVYAVTVKGLGTQQRLGVANLGSRPTVGGKETRLEVHVFDFEQSVYGQYIEVELKTFIRPEQRFENFQALTAQIKKDATTARKILNKKVIL